MNLILPFVDMPRCHLCVAAQAMFSAVGKNGLAAFTDGAPPGALKNRRSSA